MERPILTVGFDKNGEIDFGINCSVEDLTYEKYKDIREMTIVAIGQMENMWGSKRESLHSVVQVARTI